MGSMWRSSQSKDHLDLKCRLIIKLVPYGKFIYKKIEKLYSYVCPKSGFLCVINFFLSEIYDYFLALCHKCCACVGKIILAKIIMRYLTFFCTQKKSIVFHILTHLNLIVISFAKSPAVADSPDAACQVPPHYLPGLLKSFNPAYILNTS